MKQYKTINGKTQLVNVALPALPTSKKSYAFRDMTDTAKAEKRTADNRHSLSNTMTADATHNNVLHGIRSKLQAAASGNPDKINPLRNALEYDLLRDTADTDNCTLSDAMDIYADAWLAAQEYAPDAMRTIEHRDGTTSAVNAQYYAAKKATDNVIRQHKATVSKAIRQYDAQAATVYDCIVTHKDGTTTVIKGTDGTTSAARTAKAAQTIVYVPMYTERKDKDGNTVKDTDGNTVYDCTIDNNRLFTEDGYTQVEIADILNHADISDRQRRIVRYLLQGMTQADIADKLHISQPAVVKNLATIRKRMDYLLTLDNADKLLTDKRTAEYMPFCGKRLPSVSVMPRAYAVPFTHDIVSALAVKDYHIADDSAALAAWLARPYHMDGHRTITGTLKADAQQAAQQAAQAALKRTLLRKHAAQYWQGNRRHNWFSNHALYAYARYLA